MTTGGAIHEGLHVLGTLQRDTVAFSIGVNGRLTEAADLITFDLYLRK
jgi:hypothetical protein